MTAFEDWVKEREDRRKFKEMCAVPIPDAPVSLEEAIERATEEFDQLRKAAEEKAAKAGAEDKTILESLERIKRNGGGEEAFGHYGKWSQSGVPHKGWVYLYMDDVHDDLETCQMCETAQVRYVHVMSNPRWQGQLRVGCICAGRMQEDYVAAQQREANFKRTVHQTKRAEEFLIWVRAADEILAAVEKLEREQQEAAERRRKGEPMRPWKMLLKNSDEYNFICHVRRRMELAALPRTRKHRLTEDEMRWFVTIHRRVMAEVAEMAKQA